MKIFRETFYLGSCKLSVDIEKQIKTDLDLLNEENYNLIIWKSFDRVNEAFEGKTDIDFFCLTKILTILI